jgi:LysR family transcriptional regulator, glycine cleavage system transcriptional activator
VRRNLPSFPSVRAFEAAARHLSFKHAAAELCLTQSAISHQIKALEEFLDTKLFIRHAKSVELTLRGAEYLETVSCLLDGIETATQKIKGSATDGVLNIQAYPAFISCWLLPRVNRFNQLYPDIELNIWPAPPPAGDVYTFDFRVNCSLEVPQETGGEPLLRTSHVPACHPDLLENGPAVTNIDDLFYYPILRSHQWDSWEKWLTKSGYKSRPKRLERHFPDCYMALRAAEEGQGIAMAPTAFIQDKVALGRLVTLLEVEHHQILYFTLSSAKGWQNNPRARAFREWLFDEVTETSVLNIQPQVSAVTV